MNPTRKGGGLTGAQIAGISVGIFLFFMLIGVSITASAILWMRYVSKNKYGKRLAQLSKGRISVKNEIYHEMSLLSPGIMKSPTLEFPRRNLELQDVLGMS